jgi:hypothetical protein
MMNLVSRFIFEVFDGGRETSVFDHVWVAAHFEFQHERHRFAECTLLKNAAADELAGDLREHRIGARFDELDFRDFGFLMELLCFELWLVSVPLL